MKKTNSAIVIAMLAATAPAGATEPFRLFSSPLTGQTSVYDWTGFYIGIGGGTGFLIDEVNIPAFGATSISGVGGRGYFGKLTVGYDHLFSNGVVVGGAISGRYGDVDTSWSVTGVPLTGELKADYGIDVIGRLGYTIAPRTLAYVLGGYSWQHFELSSTAPAFSTGWNDSGFVVGIGTETAFRNNWTWSSEYRYSQYSGTSIAALGGVGIDPATHMFHSSLNYRFGGGPSGIERASFVHDWTGFKVGAAVSVGASLNKVTTAGGTITFDGLATEGYLGEINIGYDREFGERWVAGVVLAAEYIGASSSATSAGTTVSAKADDFGFDALLRIGRKFNDYTLGYVIGGYTWQNLSASISAPAATTDVSVNAFSIGTGTELALSEKTSAYVEYRYTMYEDVNLGGVATIEPSSHTVRVGAKFKLYPD
ncbi:outer membrane protein [Hoeflea sp. TYP-13]|uniref:outer membrane protein n=1 Tax=Hoeflea sp. TYP-13 TaxID=3230023 RepID=UPI0034C5F710